MDFAPGSPTFNPAKTATVAGTTRCHSAFMRMPGHGSAAFPTGHEGHPRQHQTRAPTRDTVVNVAKEQRRLWRVQKHKHGNRAKAAKGRKGRRTTEGGEHFMCI
ncbi:hypothetical protein KR038_008077 [Drosophila bunnanda]|nr:hypothetical protein KR038_008077 [Drosophila bunnanda]